MGLRRPALPEPALADVLRHRRMVADLRSHVPALRDAVRVRLDRQERQRLPLHGRDPGRTTSRSRAPSTTPATCRASLAWRGTRPASAATSGRCFRSTAAEFSTWWRDRLRPEIEGNFAYLDGIDMDAMELVPLAVLLEDAIDVHDRHWKIHWMINFAQFSATIALGATIAEVKGEVDPAPGAPAVLVGEPQLGLDRGALADEGGGQGRPRAAGGVRERHRRRHHGARSRAPSAAGGSSGSASIRTAPSSGASRSGRTSSSTRPGTSSPRRSSRPCAATSSRTTTIRPSSRA